MPVLHVIAGPNGAGKSTFKHSVLAQSTLEFVNADEIAARLWPGNEAEHAYEAASLAAQRRYELLSINSSFVTETVFSHESKVDLVRRASQLGYLVVLHVILLPEELSVARVAVRSELGGHDVPEDKIRSRHRRLWQFIVEATRIADQTHIYDNSKAATPFEPVAQFHEGLLLRDPAWPRWAPPELTSL